MLKRHYPGLLAEDETWAARAVSFAERVHELTAFLCDVRGVDGLPAKCHMRVAYHDACSGLREVAVERQPRRLLAGVDGLELVELADRGTCCGFGGTFAVKYPDISSAIADKKCQSAIAAGADQLVATDLGCLLHLAGRLHRCGSSIEVRHVAEILADEMKSPPIGGR
jgi:L-lactate dehydrogenase complex protein LldE